MVTTKRTTKDIASDIKSQAEELTNKQSWMKKIEDGFEPHPYATNHKMPIKVRLGVENYTVIDIPLTSPHARIIVHQLKELYEESIRATKLKIEALTQELIEAGKPEPNAVDNSSA